MGRGLNVVAFNHVTNAPASHRTFDLYASSTQSDAMLAYLNALPEGSPVAILGKDAIEFYNPGGAAAREKKQ